MIKKKPKICKGTGIADMHSGCGELKMLQKYGLCTKCYANWLYHSLDGKIMRENAIIKAKKNTEREAKQKTNAEKKAKKDKSVLQEELQARINELARMIDIDKPCISCGRGNQLGRVFHGGHYYSVGGHATIRYNLHNIYKQCSMCNTHLHANLIPYRKNLIATYGLEHYQNKIEILTQHPAIHLTKIDLEEKIIIAKQIIKEIKKGKDYTRDEINQMLDIYKN